MKPVVYVESSVISYLTADPSRELVVAGHQTITAEWWKNDLPKFKPVVSPVVLDEARAGDPIAAQKRLAAIENMEMLELTEEARELAMVYFEAIAMPESARADALHLALSTWHGTDDLVTWNCRHIASGRVKKIVSEINDARGIATPVICTPEELLDF
jgi:hypothetical protein